MLLDKERFYKRDEPKRMIDGRQAMKRKMAVLSMISTPMADGLHDVPD